MLNQTDPSISKLAGLIDSELSIEELVDPGEDQPVEVPIHYLPARTSGFRTRVPNGIEFSPLND